MGGLGQLGGLVVLPVGSGRRPAVSPAPMGASAPGRPCARPPLCVARALPTAPGSSCIDQRLRDEDKASWLTPIACCQIDGSPLSLDDYLTLVDATGRIIGGDKRGHIPPELAPILARLDIELKAWLRCMLGWRQFLGSVVGGLAARAAEAGRRGLR